MVKHKREALEPQNETAADPLKHVIPGANSSNHVANLEATHSTNANPT
jgi:hypothetical protein